MAEKDKKEKFEKPKVVDLQGEEVTKEELEDENLENVSGGLPMGELCLGGA